MNILQQIKGHYDSNSNKQKIISDYLLNNYGNIPFMSLKELSSELQVSEVTILNYCKSIGCHSFKELKNEFQIFIKEKLAVPNKMKLNLEELESVEDAYNNACLAQQINFNGIIDNNDLSSYYKISNLMKKANTVYLCGHGISVTLSMFLNTRLRSLGINAVVLYLDDFSSFSHDVLNSTKDDLFILISYKEYSVETINLKNLLDHLELTYVAITDSKDSPIAKGAQDILESENRSLVFYNFISSSIALMEILLTVLSYCLKDEFLPYLQESMTYQMMFYNKK